MFFISIFLNFIKWFRSFIAVNMKSVGQRALKLLTVKVGVLEKKSAASAIPPKVDASVFSPGSNSSRVKSIWKFDS